MDGAGAGQISPVLSLSRAQSVTGTWVSAGATQPVAPAAQTQVPRLSSPRKARLGAALGMTGASKCSHPVRIRESAGETRREKPQRVSRAEAMVWVQRISAGERRF